MLLIVWMNRKLPRIFSRIRLIRFESVRFLIESECFFFSFYNRKSNFVRNFIWKILIKKCIKIIFGDIQYIHFIFVRWKKTVLRVVFFFCQKENNELRFFCLKNLFSSMSSVFKCSLRVSRIFSDFVCDVFVINNYYN